MDIKIYYSSSEYFENYLLDFEKWKKVYTEGEEINFLNYQFNLYDKISKIIEDRVSINFNFGNEDEEIVYSEERYFRYILKHISYDNFIKYNSQNELLIHLFDHFYAVEEDGWAFNDIAFGNFRLAVEKILIFINEKRKSQQNFSDAKQNTLKPTETIKLNLTPTQIAYLFQEIEQKFGDRTHNTKYWKFISDFFIDKNGEKLKNIHQTRENLNNTKTGKPKQHSDSIDSIIKSTRDIEKPL